jgi:SAM-dependent methyltransferase
MSLRKYLIVPKLVSLVFGAPRVPSKAWDTFWGRVRRTGEGGDVLWDVESEAEMKAARERLEKHLDRGLPILDVGCGNGRHTRMLASMFPRAVGVDVSPNAVRLAREESKGVPNVEFRAVDMSERGAGERLVSELGEMNVYVRGVFHVISHEARLVMAENLARIVGRSGAIYLIESDTRGDPLDLLVFQGATPTSFPAPLELVIGSGVRPPEHFGLRELEKCFPRARWEHIAAEPTFLHTLPLVDRSARMDELVALYAVLRPRRAA